MGDACVERPGAWLFAPLCQRRKHATTQPLPPFTFAYIATPLSSIQSPTAVQKLDTMVYVRRSRAPHSTLISTDGATGANDRLGRIGPTTNTLKTRRVTGSVPRSAVKTALIGRTCWTTVKRTGVRPCVAGATAAQANTSWMATSTGSTLMRTKSAPSATGTLTAPTISIRCGVRSEAERSGYCG